VGWRLAGYIGRSGSAGVRQASPIFQEMHRSTCLEARNSLCGKLQSIGPLVLYGTVQYFHLAPNPTSTVIAAQQLTHENGDTGDPALVFVLYGISGLGSEGSFSSFKLLHLIASYRLEWDFSLVREVLLTEELLFSICRCRSVGR
jgi:hypothetical protein